MSSLLEHPIPVLIALPVLILEVVLLLMAERKFGVKVIRGNENPRDLLETWPQTVALFWILSFVLISLYILYLAFSEYRIYGICLIGVTITGGTIRRFVSIKWILVFLTIEGAARIGLYANLFATNVF